MMSNPLCQKSVFVIKMRYHINMACVYTYIYPWNRLIIATRMVSGHIATNMLYRSFHNMVLFSVSAKVEPEHLAVIKWFAFVLLYIYVRDIFIFVNFFILYNKNTRNSRVRFYKNLFDSTTNRC